LLALYIGRAPLGLSVDRGYIQHRLGGRAESAHCVLYYDRTVISEARAARLLCEHEQRWQQLIDTQERCFQVFTNFADPAALQAWSAQRNGPKLAELDRLRQVGRSARERAALDPRLGQDWYDCCTHRIDAMRKVEDTLASHLRALCERRIEQTRAELRDQQAILATLSHPSGPQTTAPIGPQLERSILDMLQEQSSRLQAMSDELDTVRASLNERKVVERAKGLLMAARTLSEDAAYKVLREAAMNQSRRLVDVAERIVEAHELLGPKA